MSFSYTFYAVSVLIPAVPITTPIFVKTKFMTPAESDYVLKNYFPLMSKEASAVLKKYMDVFNVRVVMKGSEENQEVVNKLLAVHDLHAEDLKKYTEQNYQLFLETTAAQIAETHKDTIYYNHCPVCGQLAPAPDSKQGTCGHTWA